MAELLSNHADEIRKIWNNHSVRFPIEPGTIFGEFWNVEFRPNLELALVTYGQCGHEDILVMFRPSND